MARSRSARYEVLADLESLTVRLLPERTLPHPVGSQARLEGAARRTKGLPAVEEKCGKVRIRMWQDWRCEGRRLLGLAAKALTGGSSLSQYPGMAASRWSSHS